MRRPLIAVTVALAAVLLDRCGLRKQRRKVLFAGEDGWKATSHAVVTVSIRDHSFVPAHVTIGESQAIAWRNDGATGHTVTFDGSSEQFDSGSLNPGDSLQPLRLARGRYTYHCLIHPPQSGTITVTR